MQPRIPTPTQKEIIEAFAKLLGKTTAEINAPNQWHVAQKIIDLVGLKDSNGAPRNKVEQDAACQFSSDGKTGETILILKLPNEAYIYEVSQYYNKMLPKCVQFRQDKSDLKSHHYAYAFNSASLLQLIKQHLSPQPDPASIKEIPVADNKGLGVVVAAEYVRARAPGDPDSVNRAVHVAAAASQNVQPPSHAADQLDNKYAPTQVPPAQAVAVEKPRAGAPVAAAKPFSVAQPSDLASQFKAAGAVVMRGNSAAAGAGAAAVNPMAPKAVATAANAQSPVAANPPAQKEHILTPAQFHYDFNWMYLVRPDNSGSGATKPDIPKAKSNTPPGGIPHISDEEAASDKINPPGGIPHVSPREKEEADRLNKVMLQGSLSQQRQLLQGDLPPEMLPALKEWIDRLTAGQKFYSNKTQGALDAMVADKNGLSCCQLNEFYKPDVGGDGKVYRSVFPARPIGITPNQRSGADLSTTDAKLTVDKATQRLWAYFNTPPREGLLNDNYVLALSTGADSTGAWLMEDGVIPLPDLMSLWKKSPAGKRGAHLTIISDSPNSGKIVQSAKQQQLDVTILAAAQTKCYEGLFTKFYGMLLRWGGVNGLLKALREFGVKPSFYTSRDKSLSPVMLVNTEENCVYQKQSEERLALLNNAEQKLEAKAAQSSSFGPAAR